MRVFLYKDDMKKRVLYPFLNEKAYSYFIKNLMKFKINKTLEDKFEITIPDTFLKEQTYNNKKWYRSMDGKFAVFLKDDEWKIVFQRR